MTIDADSDDTCSVVAIDDSGVGDDDTLHVRRKSADDDDNDDDEKTKQKAMQQRDACALTRLSHRRQGAG